MTEMYCPQCHKSNSTGAKFCRYCAAPLPAAGSAPAAWPQQQQQQQQQGYNAPPQAWGQHPGGGEAHLAPLQAGASGRAIASLVLTICGLVLCCGPLTSIPGAALGWLEVAAIREGRAPQKGLMLAQFGLWGGVVISLLSGFVFALYILGMIGGGFMQ